MAAGTPLRITAQRQFDEFCALYRGVRDCPQSRVTLCSVESEKVPDACLQFKNGVAVDRVDGVYPAKICEKVRAFSSGTANVDSTAADIRERLRSLINQQKCMLFMKGTPQQPKCGFSKQTVGLLDSLNCDYGHFDILSDQTFYRVWDRHQVVRQSLKEYSQWPTYPQLYVDGNLLGGLDILREMHEAGELAAALPKKACLDDRLRVLVNQAPVMVFMKGEPDAPQCKFSRALMDIFKEHGVKFESFNILSDETVRQGLKEYSKWPTYPQIYVNGELIGGVDIVKELHEAGELKTALKIESFESEFFSGHVV